jgi:hypothetical protein
MYAIILPILFFPPLPAYRNFVAGGFLTGGNIFLIFSTISRTGYRASDFSKTA